MIIYLAYVFVSKLSSGNINPVNDSEVFGWTNAVGVVMMSIVQQKYYLNLSEFLISGNPLNIQWKIKAVCTRFLNYFFR